MRASNRTVNTEGLLPRTTCGYSGLQSTSGPVINAVTVDNCQAVCLPMTRHTSDLSGQSLRRPERASPAGWSNASLIETQRSKTMFPHGPVTVRETQNRVVWLLGR